MGWFSKKSNADGAASEERSIELPGNRVDTNFSGPLRWGLTVLLLGFGGSTERRLLEATRVLGTVLRDLA